jgi:hypothetical protein
MLCRVGRGSDAGPNRASVQSDDRRDRHALVACGTGLLDESEIKSCGVVKNHGQNRPMHPGIWRCAQRVNRSGGWLLGYAKHTVRQRTEELAHCSNNRQVAREASLSAFRSNNLSYRLGPLDADEFLDQAAVEVGEPVRIESHLVEHGGVQVLDMETITDGGGAELIGFADA